MSMFHSGITWRQSAGKADTSNIKYYINHPAFLGLHISDEPYYRHFDLLAAKAEQFRETFPEDKIFYMNICWAAGLGNYV